MTGPADIVIDAVTPLGFRVVVVRSAWDVIIDFKHPDMRGREFDIAATLSEPDQVRFSVSSDSLEGKVAGSDASWGFSGGASKSSSS